MAQSEKKTYLTVHKEENIERDSALSIPLDILTEAMRALDGVDFKLYLYLYSNENGALVVYSPSQFSQTSGCHITTARKAVDKLRAAGYVAADEDGEHFYDRPRR